MSDRYASGKHAALHMWSRQTPVMRGVVLMCMSTVAFAIMHASVRFVSAELPPFQIAFFRNLFGLAFLVPLLVGAGFAQMRTRRIGLHALRGLINICAMLMFFTALSITPLAKVTALSFAAPIFAAVLSVVFLGERFRLYRWIAILFGFLGVLIILRPGFVTLEPGALLAAGAAALWAVAMILIKILSRTESSVAIVAWMGIFLCSFSVGPALWVWQTPTVWNLIWLAFIGLCGSIAQVTLSQSFKETDPTAVLPLDFLKLIWTTILGAWFFGEFPDALTWIGAMVIFSAGLFIAHRERRQKTGQTGLADTGS
ncbi:DMT family transporter [Falsiphaeobacter marinintestinus]|uniref:DMT family transporter n=1 Tax=Falsiphaeobacter marinintestinus TaxID=1492905 RepID=UPI0011B68C92|nr:DMT family transporter [Phaeobacter marinintestinus]